MSPVQAQALLQQGLVHHQAGRLTAAAGLYAQIYRVLPRHFEALHLAGAAALQLDRATEARDLLHRAAQLRPDSAATLMCLGLACAALGQCTEAAQHLRKSVKLDARNHEAWSHLASVLVLSGQLDEAAACYRRCIELKPNFAQGWTGLGSVLQLQGQPHEAIAHHTKALQLEPSHPKARFARAQAYQACHDLPRSLADFEAHLAQHPQHHEARSYRLFILNYSSALSREQLFAEHLAYGRAVEATTKLPVSPSSAARNVEPEKRLRVAFLSPDLRSHSVSFFLEPLLRYLDRNAFEIVLYHDHYVVDAVSERLKGHAALWRNFVGQSNATVEAQIRADSPDLLVDLAGHTGFNRLPLLARRLAPVQVSYLGYPNTTGLSAIDYRFTDEIADPAGESDAFYTERLVRFAPTAWAYQPPAEAPGPIAAPRSADQPFTFGSFNSFSKINDLTLRLWAEVLRAVPGSRLVLKSFGCTPALMQTRLAAAGLPMDAVVLLGSTPSLSDHLRSYEQIDVALDPFPYHGTTTTCEALWMGVPVVSLAGDRHAARVGASLLTAVGHPEWIATSREEYIRLAVDLATQPEKRAQLRASLRTEMQASPLLDHAAQAARFGKALRSCWREKIGAGKLTAPTATLASGSASALR